MSPKATVASRAAAGEAGFATTLYCRGYETCSRRKQELRMARSLLALTVLFCCAAQAERPLDEREPPFGEGDWSWLNGSNRQPNSLLKWGPLTGSVFVDSYYAFQFSQPKDHTIFLSTTAPRHNELAVNLVSLGVEVADLDGPIGRLYLQAGSNEETLWGQDASTLRGQFLTLRTFAPVQQAAVGWHFHALHGVNLEGGIFPSYFALESYFPQENWNYMHPFVSDFTPYYFAGIRNQLVFGAGHQDRAVAGQRVADLRPMARDARGRISVQHPPQRACLNQSLHLRGEGRAARSARGPPLHRQLRPVAVAQGRAGEELGAGAGGRHRLGAPREESPVLPAWCPPPRRTPPRSRRTCARATIGSRSTRRCGSDYILTRMAMLIRV